MTGGLTGGLFGYAGKTSYRAGERLEVMVDVPRAAHVRTELIQARLEDPGLTLAGPAVGWAGDGTYPCRTQQHRIGSFVMVPGAFAEPHVPMTAGAFVWPTDPQGDRPQGLLAAQSVLVARGGEGRGWVLGLAGADLCLWRRVGQDLVPMAIVPAAVRARTWHWVTVAFEGEDASVTVNALSPGALRLHASAAITTPLTVATGDLLVGAGGAALVEPGPAGATGVPSWPFNGKISQPFLLARTLTPDERRETCRRAHLDLERDSALVGLWSFVPQIGETLRVPDRTGRRDGLLVNLPVGAVTGPSWSGDELCFSRRPEHYDALRFNGDAILDVGWEAMASHDLPASLRSGVYAVRLTDGTDEDAVPVVVRPTSPTAPILVLLPTFTYLAYANEHMFEGTHADGMSEIPIALERRDRARQGAPQYGLSLYDRHSDGQGVIFSSARRAVLTDRLDYAAWHAGLRRSFSGDMYLVEWLQRKRLAFDVATDLDLHQDGAALLDRYSVVITGAHPEYYSDAMLDAVQDYRDRGGNLMYLGGNGFYQVTGVFSEDPLVIEVRRGHAGVRTWESEPGEGYLVSTGEPGGLWRHRGRAPQRLVGVGMGSQGGDRASPYRREPASRSADVAWIFDGVDGDLVGTTGLSMGAAAGDELDRVDATLGTPPETLVLARSFGHSDFFQRAIEEVLAGRPGHGGGTTDPEVRADMTYLQVPGGGAVFSVGSIAWMGSLLSEDSDPSVSRITENVVRRLAGISS